MFFKEAEVSDEVIKNTIEIIDKAKNWFFEKIYKINKALVKSAKSKRMQPTATKEEMTRWGLPQTLQIIRRYEEGWTVYANELEEE